MGLDAVIGDASMPMTETSHKPHFYPAHSGPFTKMVMMDPLWYWKREDVYQLVHEYCGGMGLLYPVVELQEMLAAAAQVFQSFESARETKLKSKVISAAEAISNDETNKLKLVIAISRNLESGGRNVEAQRLFESITEAVEGLLWSPNGISGLQLLVLVVCHPPLFSQ